MGGGVAFSATLQQPSYLGGMWEGVAFSATLLQPSYLGEM